jgi:type IV pilus assembly protein PilM
MPGQNSVWGIDLGQCALKAIKLRFDPKADRAVAEAFDFIEHPKILSQPEADPDELIKSALEKFLSRNDVSESQVFISVPGQAGLARFVKLPPVEPKRIPDIVRFEAKQQIPFPLDDVVWDYQRIGAGEVEEGYAVDAQVGIFAIKKDMANRYLAPFSNAGIEVDVVQLAPLALYNYVAYDYFYHGISKAAAKPEPTGEEQPAQDEDEEGDTVVLLDIGADKTDVVITDGDSIWLRNLPIGGNHFTRALTKELKLTFAKAEHLKRNATKAPDPKKLYQTMRPIFQDFSNELQRSIGYFLSTHRNRTVKCVLGVGNGFKLPGLQKFLQQNLNYNVERVEKLYGLSGEENIDARAFSENQLSFCVAYGLALQGLQQTPIQTNLLPQEIRTVRLIRAKKPWSLVAAACLMLGFVATFFGNYRLLRAVSSESLAAQSKLADDAAGQFARYKSDFDAAKAKLQSTNASGKQLILLDPDGERLGWIKVFGFINRAIPPRSEQQPGVELDKVDEINVEYIRAAYVPDVKAWFDDAQVQAAALTMTEEDKKNPPTGPGWVFQVLGYTFHEKYENYVRDTIVSRFQTETMRKDGITHAVVYWTEADENWTPAAGSPLSKRTAVTDLARNWGAAAPSQAGSSSAAAAGMPASQLGSMSAMPGAMRMQMSGMPGGGLNSGGQFDTDPSSEFGGMMGMLEMQKQAMPADFRSYRDQSMGRGGGMMRGLSSAGGDVGRIEPLTLLRTDFEIQFVWRITKKEDKPAGGQ